MIKQEIRKPKVQKRHKTIRVKLSGTAEFPRLANTTSYVKFGTTSDGTLKRIK